MNLANLYRALALMFLIMTGTILASPASDTFLKDLKTAGSITDADKRLSAYDAILEKNDLRKKSADESGNSKWIVSIDTDPLDDSEKITFILRSDTGNNIWGQSVALVIRKSGKETEFFISWGSYLGQEAVVTMRIGTAPSKKSKWTLSSDSKATFYPGNALEIVKEILTVDRIVAQVTPYNESPVTAVFDVKGFREEALKHKDSLGWDFL